MWSCLGYLLWTPMEITVWRHVVQCSIWLYADHGNQTMQLVECDVAKPTKPLLMLKMRLYWVNTLYYVINKCRTYCQLSDENILKSTSLTNIFECTLYVVIFYIILCILTMLDICILHMRTCNVGKVSKQKNLYSALL